MKIRLCPNPSYSLHFVMCAEVHNDVRISEQALYAFRWNICAYCILRCFKSRMWALHFKERMLVRLNETNVPTASCHTHTGMQSSKRRETTDCDLCISVQECWYGEMCVLYVLQFTLLKKPNPSYKSTVKSLQWNRNIQCGNSFRQILTSFIWALHFSDDAAKVVLPT